MQVPLEIAFHHFDPPAWAEDEIRDRVGRLERLNGRIVACRVRVDRRAKRSTQTVPPVVHIELSLPGGKDIVVAHEPERLQRRFQDPDLKNAIHDAFRVAERQLAALSDRQHDHGRTAPAGAEPRLGRIAELRPEEDHGFVLTGAGALLFFHRGALAEGEFDRLSRGDEVLYTEALGDTGPVAVHLRAKSR